MKLLTRYLAKELFQVFTFLIGALYFLFVLIDYSTHMKAFHQDGLPFIHVFAYYAIQFSQKLDILVPVTLLLTTLKVLTSMQKRGELIALLSSGIPFKKLFKPFVVMGLLGATVLYLNFEYIQPLSLNFLSHFEKSYLHKKSATHPVNTALLPNNTLLIYQHFDPKTHTIYDLFLIKNLEDIYHVRTLQLDKGGATGTKVDRFVRTPTGELVKKESLETFHFSRVEVPIEMDKEKLAQTMIPPRQQSLLRLSKNLKPRYFHVKGRKLTDKEALITATFSYKMFAPLLCIVAILAPAPYFIHSSRKFPFFLFYALFIFGLLAFFALLKAALVLGVGQLLPPFWAIFVPVAITSTYFGYRYAKL